MATSALNLYDRQVSQNDRFFCSFSLNPHKVEPCKNKKKTKINYLESNRNKHKIIALRISIKTSSLDCSGINKMFMFFICSKLNVEDSKNQRIIPFFNSFIANIQFCYTSSVVSVSSIFSCNYVCVNILLRPDPFFVVALVNQNETQIDNETKRNRKVKKNELKFTI